MKIEIRMSIGAMIFFNKNREKYGNIDTQAKADEIEHDFIIWKKTHSISDLV